MENKKIITIVSIAVVVVLALFAGGYYLIGKQKAPIEQQPMPVADFQAKSNEVTQLRDAGNYQEALVVVRATLADATVSVSSKEWFRFMEGVLLSSIGGAENRFSAIAIWRDIATDTNAGPVARSSAINSMTGNYFVDFSADAFSAIFANGDSDWSRLIPNLVITDKKLSITKIAEHSYDLYPSLDALFAMNYWYMGQLTSESLSITDDQKAEYLSVLKSNLARIDTFIATETERDGFVDYARVHRRGFPQAVVALYDKGTDKATFVEKFQTTYKDVEMAFEDRAATKHQGANLAKNVPYSYFYHAVFLNKLYGASRDGEVNALANKLVVLVKSGGGGNFINFINEQKARVVSERDHNYEYLISLSKASPVFKSMLNEHGWGI